MVSGGPPDTAESSLSAVDIEKLFEIESTLEIEPESSARFGRRVGMGHGASKGLEMIRCEGIPRISRIVEKKNGTPPICPFYEFVIIDPGSVAC